MFTLTIDNRIAYYHAHWSYAIEQYADRRDRFAVVCLLGTHVMDDPLWADERFRERFISVIQPGGHVYLWVMFGQGATPLRLLRASGLEHHDTLESCEYAICALTHGTQVSIQVEPIHLPDSHMPDAFVSRVGTTLLIAPYSGEIIYRASLVSTSLVAVDDDCDTYLTEAARLLLLMRDAQEVNHESDV